MRKPTEKYRKWNRIHEHRLLKREFRNREYGTDPSSVQFRYRTTGLAGPRVRVRCPEYLSLEHNFDEVTEFLSKVREHIVLTRRKVYVDFRTIRRLTPSGALVLAAELDRAKHMRLRGSGLRQVDASRWNPTVRRLLMEMGFFHLLQTSCPSISEPKPSDDQYVEFRSGELCDGEVAAQLQQLIEPQVSVPRGRFLYDAITEAMANVRHHAYVSRKDDIFPTTAPPYWWLSASFNTGNKEINFLIYDQGSGIHATLRKRFSEKVRGILPGDHAGLIEAAHELQRSNSNERHRGRGLGHSIRRYIKELENGQGEYRIFSGQGEYIVESGRNGNTMKKNYRGSLNGTFIQWRVQLI